MKKVFLLAFLIISQAQLFAVMTAHEYTEKYAQCLKKLFPDYQITIDNSLQLSVRQSPSYDAKHWLDNSYSEYLTDPAKFEDIVARYGKAILPRKEKRIDKGKIVPVVKDDAWIAETNAAMKAANGCEMTDYVKEDITDGLMILYAEDRGETITYLHLDDLKEIGMSTVELHTLALNNLLKILPEIKRQDLDGISYYTAGGTYEASLVLFPWILAQERGPQGGDIVFAVPTRDVLIATNSSDTAGLEKIRKAIDSIYAGKPNYTLSADLFIIRDGKFQRLEKRPKALGQMSTPGSGP